MSYTYDIPTKEDATIRLKRLLRGDEVIGHCHDLGRGESTVISRRADSHQGWLVQEHKSTEFHNQTIKDWNEVLVWIYFNMPDPWPKAAASLMSHLKKGGAG
jgi:hypothetical protein